MRAHRAGRRSGPHVANPAGREPRRPWVPRAGVRARGSGAPAAGLAAVHLRRGSAGHLGPVCLLASRGPSDSLAPCRWPSSGPSASRIFALRSSLASLRPSCDASSVLRVHRASASPAPPPSSCRGKAASTSVDALEHTGLGTGRDAHPSNAMPARHRSSAPGSPLRRATLAHAGAPAAAPRASTVGHDLRRQGQPRDRRRRPAQQTPSRTAATRQRTGDCPTFAARRLHLRPRGCRSFCAHVGQPGTSHGGRRRGRRTPIVGGDGDARDRATPCRRWLRLDIDDFLEQAATRGHRGRGRRGRPAATTRRQRRRRPGVERDRR